ncbi:hypothetical protein [Bythopirellula polymerisocia]|uniref:Uncharacterized protein n=1 Tax=Bythopirellula polymerisocia TaxID=2528003 RepID=A0A5C6CF04_9BACT|nr:hypothetical protein [Bythopirellula polymerisocia]TWU21886.1 hypothetical protein Pla144_43200 [Bythopirellula polymerisocia]
MTTNVLVEKSPADASSDPLWAPSPVDITQLDLETIQEAESCEAKEQSKAYMLKKTPEFSIDELREIARHFGVPNRAQITERETLVEAIRRRI